MVLTWTNEYRFGDFIMVKAENSAEPYIGFVNDTRTRRIPDDDYVDVFWMYRKFDIDKSEVKRQEKKTPLLSAEQEFFFSNHQDRAPVQSVFQRLSVRTEFVECTRESGTNARELEEGQMLCRFMYDSLNSKISWLKRDDIPQQQVQTQKNSNRRSEQLTDTKRKSNDHPGEKCLKKRVTFDFIDFWMCDVGSRPRLSSQFESDSRRQRKTRSRSSRRRFRR
jgi:hypothetical protein